MIQKTYHRHILVLILLLLPTMMRSQALPSLGKAKEITVGSLPNGMDYYLVTSDNQKGFADFALARKGVPSMDRERKALESLPHFEPRSPHEFLSAYGVGYERCGYIRYSPESCMYLFRNVPSYEQSVADSTLMLLFDIAAQERCPQAIIVSGDIKADKIQERMKLLSIMVPKVDKGAKGSDYQWNQSNSMSLAVMSNNSSSLASVDAIYKASRLPLELMDTPQPLVSRTFAEVLTNILKRRVEAEFRRRNIPLAEFSGRYIDSSMRSSDECYIFSLVTSKDYLQAATDILASALSSLDNYGAQALEFSDAKKKLVMRALREESGRKLSNSEYVDKCASAYFFGSNLASEATINSFLASKAIPVEKELELFNNFVSALLDQERNLTLRYSVPGAEADAEALKQDFLSSWRKAAARPYAASYKTDFGDTLSLYTPKGKVKLNSETTETISEGKMWTFSNGIKVIYKKTDVKGEFHYALMLRGGTASVGELRSGEAAFVADMLMMSGAAGLDGDSFHYMLEANGISMEAQASLSDLRIRGRAPKSKLDLLLRSLLSLADSRHVSERDYEYYRQCEALRIDMSKMYVRDVNSLMDSLMRPDYFYTGRKNAENLAEDLPERCEHYFATQFDKVNDGMLILVGDLDEETLKRELSRTLVGFRTGRQFAQRPRISANTSTGTITTYSESSPGVLGGLERGVSIALSAPVAYNIQNYMTFRVAVELLRKKLVSGFDSVGGSLSISDRLEVFPEERLNVYFTCSPCYESGLPYGMESPTPFALLERTRGILERIPSMAISKDDLKAYKALVINEFESAAKNPETLIDIMLMRYSDGKDLYTGYKQAINAVDEKKVKEMLGALCRGAKVEYVIL